MAYDLKFGDGGFYLTHSGVVTLEEINTANGHIHGDPRFDEHAFQLIDLLGADFSGVQMAQSRIPAATDYAASISRRAVKVAIVAADDAAVEFCRQYIATAKEMGSTWSFEIFAERGEAEDWARS